LFEPHDFLRPGSLLRAEDRRGPLVTEQRRRHVGESHDARVQRPPRPERVEVGQRSAALRERLAGRILKRPTETARRAGAAVDCGAAAQPYDDRLGAAVRRLPDQLPHAARRGAQRVAFLGLEQREAARRRALEDRRLIVDPAQLRADRVTERA